MPKERRSSEELKDEIGRLRSQVRVLEEERGRMQDTLSASEERLRLIYENAPIGMGFIGTSGVIEDCNGSFAQIIGTPRERLIGFSMHTGIADEAVAGALARAFTGQIGAYEGDYTVVTSGKEVAMRALFAPLFDRERTLRGVLFLAEDISERKRTEAALRESEGRYKAIVEGQAEFVVRYLPGGMVTYVNDAFCGYIDVRREQLLDRSFYPFIHPDDRDEFVRKIEALDGDHPSIVAEARVVLPNGRVSWHRWTHHAVFDGARRFVEYQCTGLDVTEQKAAEEIVRQQAELLELTHDAIFERDAADRIIFWNRGAENCYGWTAAEALGKVSHELLRTQFPVPPGDIVRQVREKGFWEGELVHQARDGRSVTVVSRWTLRRAHGDTPFSILELNIDITERKRTEEALRESEQKYKALVETTDTGFVILDGEGRVLDANDEYVRLTGNAAQQDILGKSVTEWTATHDRDRNVREITQCMARGSVRNLEIDYLRKDGSVVPVEITATVMGNGRSIRLLGLCRDISSRRRAEDELRASENRFRTLFENVSVVALVIDPADGSIIDANDAAADYYGWPRETLCAMNIGQINTLPPDELRARMNAAAERTLDFFLLRHRRADGSVRDVEVYSGPIDFEGRTALYSIIHDVTERRQAEEALKKSEDRFRTVFQTSPDAININRFPKGEYVSINAGFTLITGYTEQEVIGKTALELNIWKEPADRQRLMDAIAAGEGVHNLEARFRTKSGEILFGLMSASLIEINGEPHILSVTRDITDRKRAEQELRDTESRFREAIEFLPTPIGIADREGNVLYFNVAFTEHYGYRTEDTPTIGTWAETAYPDPAYRAQSLQCWNNDVAVAEREGRSTPTREYRILCKDGSVKDVEITMHPVGDRLVTSFNDVTGRKRSEEALKQSEGRLRTVTENAPDTILQVDREGMITFVNRPLPGLTTEQIIGTDVYRWVPQEQYGVVARALKQAFASGQRQEYESAGPGPDGEERFYSIRVMPVMVGDRTDSAIYIATDITDRKQSEQALKESEAKYRLVVENAGEGILIAQEGNLKFVNQWLLSIGGYEPGDMLDKPFAPFIHPEDREFVVRQHLRRMQGEISSDLVYDFRVLTKDGGFVWVEMKGALTTWEGKPASVNFVADISKRKKAEEALVRNERMLQTIIDAEPECVKLLDRDANLIMMNRAGLDMIQAESLEEVKGRNVCPLIGKNDVEAFTDLIGRVFQGETGTLTFEIIGLQGRPLWLETHAVPLRNEKDEIIALLGVTRDITEKKKAEDALRENQARLDLALHSAHMGVWRWEIGEDRRFFDDVTCQLLGINSSTFGGTAGEFFSVVHPEDRGRIKAALARTLEQDVSYEPDYRVIWSDGTIRHVTARGKLVRDDKGRPMRINGILWDVTEQHLFQEERLKAQKLESIGTLAGGIAHDFNNLLQGIFGYISMAKMTIDQREKSLSMLGQAEKALHQSVSLTSQLLTFSKGGKPVKRPVDIGPVIESAVAFALSGSRADHRVTLVSDLRAVEADAGQIGQVIQNIVLNADQSMPEGGMVDITVRNVHRDEAALLGLTSAEHVEISIRDSGIGIPAQFLAKIFDPYFTTKEKGSGLGLATSYSIIRNHGGMITVSSQPGKGSLFHVYLPASAQGPEGAEPKRSEPAVRSGRVLVMDDEDMVRKVAEELVRELGHDVETVEHGTAAIDAYRKAKADARPFDVVILDLTIRGGMGGLETFRNLKQLDPSVKAVMSSGYSNETTATDYRTLGFRSFLKKPYDIEKLRDVLSSLIA